MSTRPLYQSLSHRQTVAVFRTLYGNTPLGLNLKNAALEHLRAVLAQWIAQGALTLAQVEDAARACTAPAIPPAPSAGSTFPAIPAAPALPAAPAAPAAPAPLPAAAYLPTSRPPVAPQEVPPTLPMRVGTDADVLAAATAAAWSPEAIAAAQRIAAQNAADLAAIPQAPAPAALPPLPPIPTLAPAPAPVPALPVAAPQPFAVEPPPAPASRPVPAPAPASRPAADPITGRTLRAASEIFADCPDLLPLLPPGLLIPCYAHPQAPEVDPLYVFGADTLVPALIALAATPALPCWAGGPKGAGKTEFARQLAARTGRALFRVSFNRATEPAEILGDVGLRDGATEWVDGPVTQALRTPGAVLLLDEITYAAQGYLASLNGILEATGASVRLPRTGEAVTMAPDVFVIAADNTFGTGDSTGEYTARSVISADTLDRFAIKLQFAYLDPAQEARILRERHALRCGRRLRAATARAIVAVCGVARSKAGAGELQGAPGLRAAIAWAVLLSAGVAPADAYTMTVVRAAPEESQETLRAIYAAAWPAGDADANANSGAE